MRLAALPALIVGTVLQATLVRSLEVPSSLSSLSLAPYSATTPSGEQEELDDEFEVRLTPNEGKAASDRSRERKAARLILHHGDGAAGKLYFDDWDGGLGSRVLNVVGALRYAEKMNLSFGGVVPGPGMSKTSHCVNITAGMQAFFGFADVSDMYVDALPPHTLSFSRLIGLNQKLVAGAIGHGVNVHVQTGADMGDVNYHIKMSATILAALRISSTPIMQMPLVHFDPRDLNVAVHVRRGDVDAWVAGRGTTHKFYLWLMNIIRSKVPSAKFHVFSEHNKRSEHDEEFHKYSNWGAIVHVDTEARETLAHMARADVLVTAHSSFSYAAALLNPNCVLNQKWMLPGHGWVSLPGKELLRPSRIRTLTQQIFSCMMNMVERKYGRQR